MLSSTSRKKNESLSDNETNIMDKKKVVVAFSGGLDTSYKVMYLAKEKGYEVYAACANTGGFSPEQLKANEENAYKLGAKSYVTLDVTREYYDKSLRYMIYGNVLRNGTYPISVSSERIFQGMAIARYAKEIGADAILLAKAVDGIYDSDPKVNPDAKKYDEISIDEVVAKKLAAMDLTASIMCMEQKMPMLVFGLDEKDSIVNTVHGKFFGTKVTV